jgi:hypothetical protein
MLIEISFCITGRGDVFISSPERPYQLWTTPSLLFTGYCVSLPQRQSGRGLKLTTRMRIIQTLQMSKVISERQLQNFL